MYHKRTTITFLSKLKKKPLKYMTNMYTHAHLIHFIQGNIHFFSFCLFRTFLEHFFFHIFILILLNIHSKHLKKICQLIMNLGI
jgi:hypothetical protein